VVAQGFKALAQQTRVAQEQAGKVMLAVMRQVAHRGKAVQVAVHPLLAQPMVLVALVVRHLLRVLQ
jgi:hypothetical protein